MKYMILFSLFLTALVQTAHAQSCNPYTVADAPDSRYILSDNGTALDKQTGLMWKRCAEGQVWNNSNCDGAVSYMSWQNALQAATKVSFAGKTDWRVPNKKELNSLMEHKCYNPSVNLTVFPNQTIDWFWTATPFANYAVFAWSLYFGHSYDGINAKSNPYAVRLVRTVR